MKKTITILAVSLILGSAAMAKKSLNHSSFDEWKSVRNFGLSNNGEWEAYSINPQEGDGVLCLYNTRTRKEIKVERGYELKFSFDSKWAVAGIKPLFQETRKAKIDKKKKFDLPQDSLAIIDLSKGTITRIGNIISWQIGKEGGEWVAYSSCDTTLIDKKSLGNEEAGKPLVVRHIPTGKSHTVKWVDSYVFSREGTRLALTIKGEKKDSVTTDGLGIINLPDTSLLLIDRDKLHYGIPVFNREGIQLAYTASSDSVKSGTRKTELYLADLSRSIPAPEEIPVNFTERRGVNLARPHASDPEEQERLMKEWREEMAKSAGKSLVLNQYSKPEFSYNGKRLVIGVAAPVAPDDTTIVDFESATLDIWRWDAPYTPPQEKKNIDKLRKKTFPVVIDIADSHQQLLTNDPLVDVKAPNRWDGDWALILDPADKIVSYQWDYYAPTRAKVVNVNNGETKDVGTVYRDGAELSPCDRYVIWFKDRNYYCFDIASGKTVNLSVNVPYPLWDESNDTPGVSESYGIAGWSENDGALLVYDKYDIWSLDPSGEKDPVCMTKGEGRKDALRYRYVKTDPEKRFFSDGDIILLSVFDFNDKRNGYATLKFGKPSAPVLRVLDTFSFTQMRKAKNENVFSWQKANFNTSPDIWVSKGFDFKKAVKLSDANPQMKDYSWGTARLEKWYAYDGTPSEGVLYVPDDFDPDRKYPMLAVFYERSSEDLYRHYTMEPSWSWVNYPFYVSRGYVVFVPDIHYTAGVPGECAYNFVCSGVEEMCRRYPWINKDKIGIDGQSWGGYQTAYLVTRTDMFACAGSGAPVSNMTSAFGGIRWGTGDSRMGQYEMGQSRIGRNLWESPQLYLANSPVFYADRVKTPLLIMHNDDDGAVPWYQGIEMFMALRRLDKPVWMLQYNGEAHNIKERRNRKDITIRLQQFFDHYLKDEPMPRWMKEGIPAIRKGQDFGYEW